MVTGERKPWLAAAFIFGSLVFGVVGFKVVEQRSWLDSLYVVVQIFSTVGLDKHALEVSPAGRVFVVVLITVFLTGFTFAGSLLVREIVSGQLGKKITGRRRGKRVAKMRGHYIVCGYGRLGGWVVNELHRSGSGVVVIEEKADVVEVLASRDIAVVEGDATDDDVLKAAGIERAEGLVAALAEDADNVLTVLTARQLNPALRVIARANSERTRNKLVRAGAERVVLPQEMSGKRMAYALVRPLVADFIEMVTGENRQLTLDQWTLPEGSPVVGKTLREAEFRSRYGVSVLGIAAGGQQVRVAGSLDVVLKAGDTLVVMGSEENLRTLPGLAVN